MTNLKETLISLLRAFIALCKAEPGEVAQIEALKAQVADLQEQLQGSLQVDDEFRAVVAEASEAAASATPAPVAAPVAAPVVEAPAPAADPAPAAPVAGDVPAAADAPVAGDAPAAEATEGGEPAPTDKPV